MHYARNQIDGDVGEVGPRMLSRAGGCSFRDCGRPIVAKRLCTQHYRRMSFLGRTFGMALDEFATLLDAQDGRCAICGTTNPGKFDWAVDHDHLTGQVRGILCHPCNGGLGMFHDDEHRLFAAVDYLRSHAPTQATPRTTTT